MRIGRAAALGLVFVLAGCGGYESADVNVNNDNRNPQRGWVYVLDESDPGYWDLRFRCVGDNLYIENYDAETQIIRQSKDCT